MDFLRSIDGIVVFAQNNPIIAIIIVLGILFLMYRKPKLIFGLLCLGFFLAGLLYFISNMASSGSEKKKALTQEERSDTER